MLFEIRSHPGDPYNQYIDIIIQSLLNTYSDFTNNLIVQPKPTNLGFLEDKYSRILDKLFVCTTKSEYLLSCSCNISR